MPQSILATRSRGDVKQKRNYGNVKKEDTSREPTTRRHTTLCYVRKEEEAGAVRAMSEAASAACGYPVKVEAKTVGIAPMRID